MKLGKSYIFGIPVMDAQHKILIDLIESAEALLENAKEGGDCIDEVVGILEELEAYTVTHFEDEEKMLLAVNYEGFEEQHMEHTFFIKKVEKALAADIEGDPIDYLKNLCAFLKNWVTHHILDVDVKYVTLLRDKNI